MKLPDLKRPDLKLKPPQLRRKPSGSKSSVKAPKFATDLYADLRDRRLLPLVAVLLVAIVATPILLASGDDEKAPMPIAPVAGEPSAAAQASFAVVPEEATLRDYRTRLRHRQARNPFREPPAPAEPAPGGEPASASGGDPEATGGEAAPVEAEADEAPAPKTTTKVVVQSKVLGYEIDTRAGYVGNVKAHKGIVPTTKLPNPKKPVIVFTGFSKDNKRALFLMSSNVTAYYGKARCALDKQACQLVELAPGRSATFAYGYGDSRYKLTLQRIVPIVGVHKTKATVTAGSKDSGGTPSGK